MRKNWLVVAIVVLAISTLASVVIAGPIEPTITSMSARRAALSSWR